MIMLPQFRVFIYKSIAILVFVGFMVLFLQFTFPAKDCQPNVTIRVSDSTTTYEMAKVKVVKKRKILNALFVKDSVDLDSIGRVFTDELMNTIIPYWYGTEWDFNGYTAVPHQGSIACGYFVSTTLQHAGINLNRYKMAQKSSMDGALMLEPKDSLWIKYCSRDEYMVQFEKKTKDGLYMIGLSSHVGYLFKSGNKIRFIHSSYVDPVCVVNEDARTSVALGHSKIFVLADITYNAALMKKWMNGEVLKH